MSGQRKRMIVALLLLVLAVAAAFFLRDQLTIEQVKRHREQLLVLIESHYALSVLSFVALYLSTALFLPGALALTVAGGMLFGLLPALLYVNVGATAGAVLAFLAARYLLGHWVQERYRDHLGQLNSELERHGSNYLLMLRMLPVLPFFAVNYCAGISKIPLGTFVWTTSVGIVPGSLVYAYIGIQLRYVNAAHDLFSMKIVLGFAGLALLAIAPAVQHHFSARKRRE